MLVAKYADHLPLYRQSEIYEREGIELDRSTLADWVGGASRVLAPLEEATRRYVLNTAELHGDDIPLVRAGARQRKNQNGAPMDLCS